MSPRDRDSNIIWFARECRSNRVALESLIRSAERAGDRDLAEFLRRADEADRRLESSADAA
jgi:hypothetical protein